MDNHSSSTPQSIPTPDMKINKYIAEFIGTFTLCFVGISAITMTSGGNLVAIALAHGLALVTMVSAFGHISGGMFNPAVSVGVLLAGKMKPEEFISYIISQLLGAVFAAWLVGMVFPHESLVAVKWGTPTPGANVSFMQAFIMEIVLTFFLVSVVFGTAVDAKAPKVGGLFIGLTVAMDILAGGAISGASMNPARTFGPALLGGVWEMHIVYWLGPIIGGILAAIVYKKFMQSES
ncbi:MAG: aquaporin [Ignavibacteriales bacterium]|nr:aquaporin [Ignavibacteriales bacterium]